MTTRADRVAQVVELLLSKCKALNSNPLPPKKKKKKKKREGESNNVKSQGIEDGDVSAMEI
jgi:hypothetical protein